MRVDVGRPHTGANASVLLKPKKDDRNIRAVRLDIVDPLIVNLNISDGPESR